MAHYAYIDENNIVVEVIVGRDENDVVDGISDWETYYATKRRGLVCKRTSYNTYGNQHSGGGEPFRGNYAGIGFTYDPIADVFIAPSPYPSWVLNNETYLWEAPIPYPTNGGVYYWDESSLSWVEMPE